MRTQLPLPKRVTAPDSRPMFVVSKRLNGLRCDLLWRQASAQATLCQMGSPLPSQKGGGHNNPNVGPCILQPNDLMDQYETWHGGTPRPRRHCVRRRPSPLSPKGHSPQFSAHVCCGQTAGWIKMPVGTEVALGPGHIVSDGDQVPSPKGAQQPSSFGPFIFWPNGRPSQLLVSTCLLFCDTVLFSTQREIIN